MLKFETIIVFTGVIIALVGCGTRAAPAPTLTPALPQLAEELVLYDWEDDIPRTVLDAFTQEYGVKITYVTFESTEEAVENIRAGQDYDVVVIENQFIPALVEAGLLAEIDHSHLPNFDNIAPNYKGLAYDPDNNYSIPFNWGTTGLVIRHDLAGESIAHWSDLWEPRYTGKVAIRSMPREIISMTLKSLGYSANSEVPTELEAALKQLQELRQGVILVGSTAEEALPVLARGEVVLLVGWAEDVLEGREKNLAISYVSPAEGPLLWGDNFVIPASSPHKYTAELFLDFLLRPEISAWITNENYYASPNEAARPFIEPEILNDPVIFPSNESLKNAEVLLPLSPEGEALYSQVWKRFLAEEF
jgi:spermidine/putrescine transport system substrate-binding protein